MGYLARMQTLIPLPSCFWPLFQIERSCKDGLILTRDFNENGWTGDIHFVLHKDSSHRGISELGFGLFIQGPLIFLRSHWFWSCSCLRVVPSPCVSKVKMAGLVRGVRRLSMLIHVRVHARVARVSTRFVSTEQHDENGAKIPEEETSSVALPSASSSVDRWRLQCTLAWQIIAYNWSSLAYIYFKVFLNYQFSWNLIRKNSNYFSGGFPSCTGMCCPKGMGF